MSSVIILGGRVVPAFDLSISGSLPVAEGVTQRNEQHARGRGLKSYREVMAARPRLAVVGGGPSINRHVDEIKAFDGDVWAINGAFHWCRGHGIDAAFIACDPHPRVATWANGAKRALLEMRVDTQVFDLLANADVAVFDCGDGPGMIRCGTSTVSSTPHLAVRMGYRQVTLFGCESSYPLQSTTHAFQHEERADELLIACDGKEYLTAADYYMQAMELSRYVREVPEFIIERCGGLLRAMIASGGEHKVRWISEGLANGLSPILKPGLAA
jgi:hypothetical protein